jgi:phosphatidylserine/phosphatidylglycerophosphate/cardiolipin synthase-like enzyme
MNVRVYHNGDDVLVAWKPQGLIDECRGFALLRRRNGVEEIVSTWVGFEDEDHSEGERRASTNWPIQKYQWVDYMAVPGDTLQYRVVPMVGPSRQALRPDTRRASQWTDEISLSHEFAPGIQAYFNRGIVAAQWVSRRLGANTPSAQAAKLRRIIATEGDPFREYLFGPLGKRLFALLAEAATKRRQLYAVLYELDDEQLQSALKKCGQRAHVVLGNGSVQTVGEDQNGAARSALLGHVDLHDRMTSPRALAHNKFLVLCDDNDNPRWVWTGSQNWTRTGLCTQANNSILIDAPALAAEYRTQWDLLRSAGDATRGSLRKANSTVRRHASSGTPLRLWFTPTVDQVDLKEARKIISGARQAVLFLMFNPGPRETLLNEIIETARAGRSGGRLYIRGVLNQDPSTTKTPVQLFDQRNWLKADFALVLPAAIDKLTSYWSAELKKLPGTFAMVHSKTVLVDPFGRHPVLLTGSHNLGPKASGTNDENLLIVRGAPGLAAAYATNIMAIYHQYRWRFRRQTQPQSQLWAGLEDGDSWQAGYLKAGSAPLREIDFWVGA